MALPWDYETWPKPDESEEELKRARLQDVEFESWLKSVSASEDDVAVGTQINDRFNAQLSEPL